MTDRGDRIRTCDLVLPKHSFDHLRIPNKIKLSLEYNQFSGTDLRQHIALCMYLYLNSV